MSYASTSIRGQVRRSAAGFAGFALLAGLLLAPNAAAPAQAAARTGLTAASTPTMTTWTGRVKKVLDGDTANIEIAGDGKGPIAIRNAGIQAMEVGECHAAHATARHNSLVLGKRIRLSAQNPKASSLGRPVRFIDYVSPTTGKVTDIQLKLIREGHVVWLNGFAKETSRERVYLKAMQEAMAHKKFLWDPAYCKSGPQQEIPIKLWINYDADGNDSLNLNGEYVRIANHGKTTLNIGGWWVRDGSRVHSYRFPTGTTIAAGKVLTLRAGYGTNTATTKYLRYTKSPFGNPETGGKGDAMYLFDPHGDIRAHASYLCWANCADPLDGKVKFSQVLYDPAGNDNDNVNGEYIEIMSQNTTSPIDLSYRTVEINGNRRELPRMWLYPGEKLRYHVGKGTSSRLKRFWGRSTPMLPNAGHEVRLRNSVGRVLACRAWGSYATDGC